MRLLNVQTYQMGIEYKVILFSDLNLLARFLILFISLQVSGRIFCQFGQNVHEKVETSSVSIDVLTLRLILIDEGPRNH